MYIKRKINNWIYKIRYAKKHLSIGKRSYVIGRDTTFEGYNRIGDECRFQGSMGYGSYIGDFSQMNATVGKYSCISKRVYTVSGTHPTNDFVSIHPSFYSTSGQAGFTYVDKNYFEELNLNKIDNKTAVYIGNDVWIGCNVVLIGGIKIGDGAIVAAGSVVTKDVEPYAIVGGVPAKTIRKRFDEEQINALMNYCWWDKSSEWLQEHYEDMHDIETFMKKYS